jgi:hypothetical protein
MAIEIFAWCSSRQLFIDGMTSTAFPDGSMLATLDADGRLIPHEGVIIDEIGPIVKSEDVTVAGHHVNLLAIDPIVSLLMMGPPDAEGKPTVLPQYDAQGNLLSVFERTNILSLIPGMVWTAIPGPGVPGGYEGPNGVCLFDPAVVNNRARVWL